jgi:hypothetical protein
MNFFRTNKPFRLFTFLLALHILNVSVNAPDYVPVSLSINEMESISEIICEKILHIENAFPEQHRQNNPDHGAPAASYFMLAFFAPSVITIIPFRNFQPLYQTESEIFFSQHSDDILTPPPKA